MAWRASSRPVRFAGAPAQGGAAEAGVRVWWPRDCCHRGTGRV